MTTYQWVRKTQNHVGHPQSLLSDFLLLLLDPQVLHMMHQLVERHLDSMIL